MNTQRGNNNPYNQDNETTWLDWDLLERNAGVFRFCRLLIAFRKGHPSIARGRFWRDDVSWYGVAGGPDYSAGSHALAYCLRGSAEGDADLYVMFNSHWEPARFEVQDRAGHWRRAVDTSLPSPHDIVEPGSEVPLDGETYTVEPRSVVVLVRGPRTQPAAGARRAM